MRILLITLSLIFISCQKEEAKSNNTSAVSDFTQTSVSAHQEDDFSDLKKKDDESCADKTAKEIVEKVETKAVSLQGGSSDCVVK